MFHRLFSIAFLAGSYLATLANAAVSTSVIYQFNSSVLPENLILRPNGQLLVVANSQNVIYQLDPNQGSTQTPRIVHTFPGINSMFGLVQLSTDVYVTATGNFSVTTGDSPGTWSLWTVDLTGYTAPTYNVTQVKVKQVITPVSYVSNFDGLVVLNATAGLIAATDAIGGAIWRANIKTNNVTSLVTSTQLTGVPGGVYSSAGANGLKISGNQLYFTVTGRDYLGVISVNTATGLATSGLQTVFNYTIHLDDFNIAPSGNIYLSTLDTNPGGGILKRTAGTPNGQNGTSLVVSEYGTNAVVFQNSTSTSCTLIISAALQNQISKAVLPQAC